MGLRRQKNPRIIFLRSDSLTFVLPHNEPRLFTHERYSPLTWDMEREGQRQDGDRCFSGKCWCGPVMIVATEKGAIADLAGALRLFLSKFHGKEIAAAMVYQLTLGHVHAERTIIAHSVGREPDGSILREICALIAVYGNGQLRTHCAQYVFRLQEDGDEVAYRNIETHYRWMATVRQQPDATERPLGNN